MRNAKQSMRIISRILCLGAGWNWPESEQMGGTR